PRCAAARQDGTALLLSPQSSVRCRAERRGVRSQHRRIFQQRSPLGWMIEALSGARPLGIDQNNAHVQPNGAYHYHGVPTGLVALLGARRPLLIGWAADGFPIYLQEDMRPSWRLKRMRDAGGPGGVPDGTYSLDYEYVRGLGELDECNGR